MTNWIWNPFTGNLDGCGGDGALDFVIKQKRLIWDTDTDWNKGTLGTDVEVVGSGAAAEITPKTTIWPGTEVYLTWHLNETEGTVAADSAYYNRPGTLMTVSEFLNPSLWVAGKLNNAISNPGEYEAVNYIDGGDIAAFEWNEPFSVEFWVNHTAGYDVSLAGNYDSADDKGWQVYIQEDFLRFDLHGGPGLFLQVYPTTKVTTSIYQHVVITYDGSGLAAGVKFYLDGLLLENSVYADGLTESSIIPASNDFRVMANMRTGWGWIGQLDEFIIYTVVLTQANVDFRYNAGDGTQTPVFTQPIYPTTAHYETNIADSKIAGQYWGAFNFGGTVPGGTTVTIKVRVSDNIAVMGSYGAALTPGAIIGLNGQFIQFSVDFTGTDTVRSMVDYISSLFVAPDVVDVAP
jgi:hypothetical protein